MHYAYVDTIVTLRYMIKLSSTSWLRSSCFWKLNSGFRSRIVDTILRSYDYILWMSKFIHVSSNNRFVRFCYTFLYVFNKCQTISLTFVRDFNNI